MRTSRGHLFRDCYRIEVFPITYIWQRFKGGQKIKKVLEWTEGRLCRGPAWKLLAWGRWRRAPGEGTSHRVGVRSTVAFLWPVLSWKWGLKNKKVQVVDQVLTILAWPCGQFCCYRWSAHSPFVECFSLWISPHFPCHCLWLSLPDRKVNYGPWVHPSVLSLKTDEATACFSVSIYKRSMGSRVWD